MLLLLRMIIMKIAIKSKNSRVNKNDNVKEIKAVTTNTESTVKTKIIVQKITDLIKLEQA